MKKFIAIAVTGLMALAVKADYSANSYLNWFATADETLTSFSYAELLYRTSDAGEWTSAKLGTSSADYIDADGTGNATPFNYANIGTGVNNNYSFMAKVYNDTDVLVGESAAIAYSVVKNYLYTDMGAAPSGAQAFTVTNVPEPTSGLLLLIGVAGLALRRKRGRDETSRPRGRASKEEF